MSDKITVYGFEASTYVRTVRMVLAEKGAEYDLVPVDIMAGENKRPEHLARHPFAKIPVVEHGAKRLYETGAITRYLNDALAGTSLIPDGVMDRARMDLALGLPAGHGPGFPERNRLPPDSVKVDSPTAPLPHQDRGAGRFRRAC